jgi:hypothetical protein
MKVRFRVNLGSSDGAALRLDNWQDCRVGAEVDLPDAAAGVLVARGVAEPVAVDVRGVAKQPELTAPAPAAEANLPAKAKAKA